MAVYLFNTFLISLLGQDALVMSKTLEGLLVSEYVVDSFESEL